VRGVWQCGIAAGATRLGLRAFTGEVVEIALLSSQMHKFEGRACMRCM
jgi:hypothetical protein